MQLDAGLFRGKPRTKNWRGCVRVRPQTNSKSSLTLSLKKNYFLNWNYMESYLEHVQGNIYDSCFRRHNNKLS